MTLSQDLFLSILAMDAYNRGYGSGRDIFFGNKPDGSTGEKIHNTTIIADSTLLRDDQDNRLDEPEGFYAAAYKVDGSNEIIISYRGTDDATDAWNDAQLVTRSYGDSLGYGDSLLNPLITCSF